MKSFIEIKYFVVLFRLFSLCYSNGDEIIGCGGFILAGKAGALDLTRVEIKLYTKQGSLKYQTDCAPNNGYYFIPVYDKGEYIIKVAAPSGWTFSPSEHSINIDGTNDYCSLGKDLNFELEGFSVQGVVQSRGRNSGPSGVSLTLYDSKDMSVLKAETSAGGKFEFTKVLPGTYKVKSSHPKYTFDNKELHVEIKDDSVTVEKGIEVMGYDVRGNVISEGEPIQGVVFTLFAQNDIINSCGVDKPDTNTIARGDLSPRCQTVSNDKGEFIFPAVVPGSFLLVPTYRGENIQFDIKPSSIDFEVNDESVNIPQTFEVQGFRVSGHIYQSQGGERVSGARVILNGQQVTTTDETGTYFLENIRSGTYTLNIESDLLAFDPLTVRIGPNTPYLPDIAASKYKVCGKINTDTLPPSLSRNARQVIFIPQDNDDSSTEPLLTSVESSGSFCQFLKPGDYKLEPMILETEVSAGLKLNPSSYEIHVDNVPLSGFEFTQFLAKIQGRIKCLGSCGSLTVQLMGNVASPRTLTSDSRFEFDEVLPGKYNVNVLKDDWCWKENSVSVEVTDSDVSNVEFQQTGFYVTVISSHETDLVYRKDEATGVFGVPKGTSKHCLEEGGTYTFKPEGCHVFSPETVEFSTLRPSAITLKATKHRIVFRVKADKPISDLVVDVSGSVQLQPTEVVEASGSVYHVFSLNASPGETLELVPRAESLLFFPEKVSVTARGDCDDNAAEIVAQRGLFLTGTVHPAISDVEITIRGSNLDEPSIVLTNANGEYTFGPVNKEGFQVVDLAAAFQISAEKKGYVLKPLARFGDFAAEKLAELIVDVSEESGNPLQGVLVTVAGGVNNRFNSQTGPDGKVVFTGLSPGDFFVKPVLKEYRFEPTSKMVHVEDGASVTVTVKGERTAYSCYGVVSSLNGQPEGGIVMEAVGTGEKCHEYQEEAITESNGQFRIRGLRPQCEYIVKLRTYNGANRNLERTLPPSVSVQVNKEDVKGLHFAAIKAINQADVAVSIRSASRDYLKSLELKIYREDEPDYVVHSIKVNSSAFIMLPALPMDGRRYFILVKSSLPASTFEYRASEASFAANVSAQHVVVHFDATRKPPLSDSAQVSVSAVVLLLLCAAAAYNYDKVGYLLTKALAQATVWLTAANKSQASASAYQGNPNNPVFTEKELALIESSTKKKPKPKKA